VSGSPGRLDQAGGSYADRAFVTLWECTFEGNVANFGGGARFYRGTVQASHNLFVNNAAQVHWSSALGSMGVGGGFESDNVNAYFYGDAFIGIQRK
jgi:hypothetical protein